MEQQPAQRVTGRANGEGAPVDCEDAIVMGGKGAVGNREGLWGHREFELSMLIPSVMFDFLSIARIQENVVCLFVCFLG